jgi:hypothetical protein
VDQRANGDHTYGAERSDQAHYHDGYLSETGDLGVQLQLQLRLVSALSLALRDLRGHPGEVSSCRRPPHRVPGAPRVVQEQPRLQ